MPELVHSKTDLQFTIKNGEVKFKQKESYKLGEDESFDVFKGQCDLGSDNLKEWMHSVIDSWIDAKSVRAEAIADDKESE